MKLVLINSLVVSTFLHGLIFFGGFEFLAWQKAHHKFVAEIDLQSSSLLLHPRARRTRTGAVPPPQPWIMPKEDQLARVPSLLKPPVAPKLKIAKNENEDEQAGPVDSPGKAMGSELVTEWLPAAAATHSPEWVDGMITEDDYPAEAKAQGKEGKVVASVCIDVTGSVKDVQITEGNDPEFNQLVLQRLRNARFKPGLDQNSHPIAVRMSIPIVFELH
jgi:TonB family protein